MQLSIIILNYNTRGLLRQCLKAINKNSPDFSYEVIVVDNHSSDKSAEMIEKEFPQVKFLALDKNYGYAGGNNQGLKAAEGEYLAILNPDVLVMPGSLAKLVQFLDENKEQVGMVGPKLLNPNKSLQYSCFKFPDIWTPIFRRTPLGFLPFAKRKIQRYLMAEWEHERSRDVDWLMGGAIAISRRAYQRVGGLDERFFLYFDDVDYARRMHEAGFRVVYLPQVEMIHFHQRESAGSFLSFFTNRIARIHVCSALKYFWKWRKPRSEKS